MLVGIPACLLRGYVLQNRGIFGNHARYAWCSLYFRRKLAARTRPEQLACRLIDFIFRTATRASASPLRSLPEFQRIPFMTTSEMVRVFADDAHGYVSHRANWRQPSRR